VPAGTKAVVLNVTSVNTTPAGYLTVYPHGLGSAPVASGLSWSAGETTAANLVVVELGPTGDITIYDSAGSANVVVDVTGWYG
jgi:hypothetical protein